MRKSIEVVNRYYPYLLLRILLEWHKVHRKIKETPDLSVKNIFPEFFEFVNPKNRSEITPVLEKEIEEWYNVFTEFPPANEEVNLWIPNILASRLDELINFWKKVRAILRGERVKDSQNPGILFGTAGNIFQFLYPFNTLFLYKEIPNIFDFWKKREKIIVEGLAESISSMSKEERKYQIFHFEKLYFDSFSIDISENLLNLLQKHNIPLTYINGESGVDEWILSGKSFKETLQHSWFDSLKRGQALPEVYLSLLNIIPEDVIEPEEYIKTAPKFLYRKKDSLSIIRKINNWKALKGFIILYYNDYLEPETNKINYFSLPNGIIPGGTTDIMPITPGIVIKILALSLEETTTNVKEIKEKIDNILEALAKYGRESIVSIMSDINNMLSSDETLEKYYRFYSGFPFMKLKYRKREMESILEYIKHFFYKRDPSLVERIYEGKWLLDLKYADEVHNL